MDELPADARAKRTRFALHRAFASLIQFNHYENLRIADVTTLAGVSRSTFYAHYSSKDALLAGSISGPFGVLVDTLEPNFNVAALTALLDHFWDNRVSARGILTGTARRKTCEVLVRLIERRLASVAIRRRGGLILPRRLAAIQLSEILLAPVTAWLLGESRCASGVLAAGLRQVSLAALESMYQ